LAFENIFSGSSMEKTFGNIEIIVRFITFFQKFLLFGLSGRFSTLIEYECIEVFIELDFREVFCGSVNSNIHAHLHRSNDQHHVQFIVQKNYFFLKQDLMFAKENT
jgi:hypothetical protein